MLSSQKVDAQQAPTYAVYLPNVLLVNPAFAGSAKATALAASYRKQWAAVEGAPITQTISVHAPLANESVGLGLSVVNEQAGLLQHLYLSTCYSYRINLGDGVLAMGLNLGAIQFGIDNSKLDPRDRDDIQLFTNNSRSWKADIGTGFYYQTKRFNLSISSQHLNQNKVNLNQSIAANYMHRNISYLISSYSIDVNSDFSLLPALCVRHTYGGATQYDLGFYAKEKHSGSLGINYRSNGIWSFQMMLQSNLFFPKMKDQWAIGYAYDYAVNGLTAATALGNEIILTYKIAPKKRLSKVEKQLPNVSPKFF